jgi:hypothetical protein
MTETDYFHARAVECDKLADEAREPEAKRILREAAANLRAMAVQAERGISSSGIQSSSPHNSNNSNSRKPTTNLSLQRRSRPPHVWMAPRHARAFFVKARGRLRSCVRPFCAVTYGPLALMDSAGRGLISWSGFKSP